MLISCVSVTWVHEASIRRLLGPISIHFFKVSPLLANIYLNEFDQEFAKRGVPCIRYADDIVLLAKSRRASERILTG